MTSFFMLRLVRWVVIVAMAFLPVYAVASKEALVVYLPWYSGLGAANGCDIWKKDGYLYRGWSRSRKKNHSLYATKIKEDGVDSRPRELLLTQRLDSVVADEMADVRGAGFDVVVVDVLPFPKGDKKLSSLAGLCGLGALDYVAKQAKEKNLSVAVMYDVMNRSGDYPEGYRMTYEDWVEAYSLAIDRANRHDNYWRPSGVPAILQFGAGEGAIDGRRGASSITRWAELKRRLESDLLASQIYLDVRPNTMKIREAGFGEFIFAPAAPQLLLNKWQTEIKKSGRPLLWTISPGYYNQALKTFVPPDFSRIHNGYMQAMQAEADRVMVITWNDYDEDTDIAYSTNKGKALLWLFGFYNSWFKSGKIPNEVSPVLIVSAPLRIPEKTSSGNVSWVKDGAEYRESSKLGRAFFWVYVKEKSDIHLNGRLVRSVQPGVTFGEINIDEDSLEFQLSGAAPLRFSPERTTEERQGGSPGGLEYGYGISVGVGNE